MHMGGSDDSGGRVKGEHETLTRTDPSPPLPSGSDIHAVRHTLAERLSFRPQILLETSVLSGLFRAKLSIIDSYRQW